MTNLNKPTKLQKVDADIERWEDRRETAIKALCKAQAVLKDLYKRRARVHQINYRTLLSVSVAAGEVVEHSPDCAAEVPNDDLPDFGIAYGKGGAS